MEEKSSLKSKCIVLLFLCLCILFLVLKYAGRAAEEKITAEEQQRIEMLSQKIDAGEDVYQERAEIFLKLGRLKKALKDYDKAIAKNPKNPELFLGRARCLQAKEEWELAIIDCDLALAIKGDMVDAYLLRGASQSMLEDHLKAIEDYKKVISLDAQNFYAYYNMGSAKLALKKGKEAIADFDKTIALGYEGYEVYYQRALAKEVAGEKGALEDYKAALVRTKNQHMQKILKDKIAELEKEKK